MYGDYSSSYNYSVSDGVNLLAIIASIGFFGIILSIAFSVFLIICNWKVYEKAGQEGWKSIIPIYSTVVLLNIVELPTWYVILLFVPFANIYVAIKLNLELAKKFGKTTGFAVGLILLQPIFLAILAFDKNCVYVNSTNQQTNQSSQNMNQQNNVKYCHNCGTPNVISSQFCANCGTQI